MNSIISKGIFILIWILFVSLFTYSHNPYFKNYTVEDGLAGDIVYRVLQDRDGYIWFATETGVSRYDGNRFVNYTAENGLSANEVLKIFEDSKGRIWFLTYSGRPSYFLDGKFFNIHNDTLVKNLCFGSLFTTMMEDKAGNLWLASNSAGIIKVDNNNMITHVNRNYRGTNGLWEDKKGAIMTTHGNSIMDMAGKITEKSAYQITESSLPFGLSDGSVLMATDKGIVNYDRSEETLIIENSQDLIKGQITNMVIDTDSNLWLCTDNGAVIFEKQGMNWNKTAEYLNGKIVTSVLQDNEANYWFTTLGHGVFFIPSRNVISYTVDEGLADKTAYSLAQDSKGNIWMGMDNQKFSVFKDNQLTNGRIRSKDPLVRKRITNIMMHSDGSIWLAGDRGVFRINEGDTAVIYSGACKFILEGKDNNVWISTVFGAVSFDKANEAIIKNDSRRIELKKLCVNTNRTHAMCYDANNNLLLGTNEGLQLFNGDTVLWYPYEHPLLKERITSIQLSNDGAIWFGTSGMGIGVLRDDSLIHLTTRDGLSSNICNSLYIDDDNNAWAATNKGLNKINISLTYTIEVKKFTRSDGLASNSINAVHKHGDTVWAATAKGLSYFAESNMNQRKPPPKIKVTKFTVSDNEKFIINADHTYPHSFNNISIEYTGISYYSQGDIQYKYKLVDADTSWNYTRSTIVEYPSLPYGEHQFIVNAANYDGVWSNEPAQISFTIDKPFWSQWWFLLLEVIGMGLFMSIVIYYIIVRVNMREQRRISFRMKLAEAEQQALRAQINPHFIFNSLNTIQRFIIKNEKETAYVYLEKFGSLIRKILKNSREELIPIQEELETLELYLELEKKRFEEEFDYVFTIDPQIETNNIKIPTMLLQPLVENSIKHGIMPSKTRGEIVVNITKAEEVIICSVQDNGIGRAKAAKLNEGKFKRHKSLGLNITQERIELLRSNSQDDYNMKITDLKNDRGESTGTLVEIIIPLSIHTIDK
ncbi:MAG: hypothetical protein COA57_05125 [Flavobacteriales bacterium]|nr:MAG: hypothetical protein COA57_05125 [Flavobacteriales bacterium]